MQSARHGSGAGTGDIEDVQKDQIGQSRGIYMRLHFSFRSIDYPRALVSPVSVAALIQSVRVFVGVFRKTVVTDIGPYSGAAFSLACWPVLPCAGRPHRCLTPIVRRLDQTT